MFYKEETYEVLASDVSLEELVRCDSIDVEKMRAFDSSIFCGIQILEVDGSNLVHNTIYYFNSSLNHEELNIVKYKLEQLHGLFGLACRLNGLKDENGIAVIKLLSFFTQLGIEMDELEKHYLLNRDPKDSILRVADLKITY